MNVSTFLFLPEPAPQPDVTGGAALKELPAGPEGGSDGSFLSFMESVEGGAGAGSVPTAAAGEASREAARGPSDDEGEGTAGTVEIDGDAAAPVPPGVVPEAEHVGASETDGKEAVNVAKGEVIEGEEESRIRQFGDRSAKEGTRTAPSDARISMETGKGRIAGSAGESPVSVKDAAGGTWDNAAGKAAGNLFAESGDAEAAPERPKGTAGEGTKEHPEAAGRTGRVRPAADVMGRMTVIRSATEGTGEERMIENARARTVRDGAVRAAAAGEEYRGTAAEKGETLRSDAARAAGGTTEEPAGSEGIPLRRTADGRIEKEGSGFAGETRRTNGAERAGTEGNGAERAARTEGESVRVRKPAAPVLEETVRARASAASEGGERPERAGIDDIERHPLRETAGHEPRSRGAERAGRLDRGGEVLETQDRTGKGHAPEARESVSGTAEVAPKKGEAATVRTDAARTEGADRNGTMEIRRTEVPRRSAGEARSAAAERTEPMEIHPRTGTVTERTEVRHGPSPGESARVERNAHGPEAERTEVREATAPSGAAEAKRIAGGEGKESIEIRAGSTPTEGEAPVRSVGRPAGAAAVAVAGTDPVREGEGEPREPVPVSGERPASPAESERSVRVKASSEGSAEFLSDAPEEAETKSGGESGDRSYENPRGAEKNVRFGPEAAAAEAARTKVEPAGYRPVDSPAAVQATGVKEPAEIPVAGQAPSPEPVSAPADRAERALLESRAVREGILERLIERTRGLVRTNRNEAEVQLDPPELGKVRVKLIVADATVRGFIEVENPNVQAALQSDMSRLTAALADSGLDLSQFDVLLHDERRSGDGRSDGAPSGRSSTERKAGDGAEERSGSRPREGDRSRLVDTWM